VTKMTTHFPSVVGTGQHPHHNGPLYLARCACGWEGELQLDETTATQQARNHAWPDGQVSPKTIAEYDQAHAKIAAILEQ
jgi:hypothetical protein